MFPPQKNDKTGSKPAAKRPQGPPQGGPPPGGPPQGGMPPQGGSPLDPLALPPGAPPPGRGMDPMMAMMHGLGPGFAQPTAPPQGPPMGPDGMPFGGALGTGNPATDDADMGGSDLLSALHAAMSGGGDPYGLPPAGPDHVFDGTGQGDPSLGLQQMLQMLALAQAGVGGGGGGMPAGGSGVPVGQPSTLGSALGFGC